MFHCTSEHPEHGCGSNGKQHVLNEAELENNVRTEPASRMIVEISLYIYIYAYTYKYIYIYTPYIYIYTLHISWLIYMKLFRFVGSAGMLVLFRYVPGTNNGTLYLIMSCFIIAFDCSIDNLSVFIASSTSWHSCLCWVVRFSVTSTTKCGLLRARSPPRSQL